MSLLALISPACGSSLAAVSSAGAASGIDGRVLLGPTCPVERVGHPCVRPYQTSVAVYTASGSGRIATFRSGSNGHFRVGLPPGRYRLQSTHTGLPVLRPVLATVKRDRYTTITITFDTEIR